MISSLPKHVHFLIRVFGSVMAHFNILIYTILIKQLKWLTSFIQDYKCAIFLKI